MLQRLSTLKPRMNALFRPGGKVFYGWWIVLACAGVQWLAAGEPKLMPCCFAALIISGHSAQAAVALRLLWWRSRWRSSART